MSQDTSSMDAKAQEGIDKGTYRPRDESFKGRNIRDFAFGDTSDPGRFVKSSNNSFEETDEKVLEQSRRLKKILEPLWKYMGLEMTESDYLRLLSYV